MRSLGVQTRRLRSSPAPKPERLSRPGSLGGSRLRASIPAKRKGLLFAGTERGAFVSFDDGDNWQALQLNLPVTSVRDFAIHANDLIVGTHGRTPPTAENANCRAPSPLPSVKVPAGRSPGRVAMTA